MTFHIYEDVFRLQISEHDVIVVQVFKAEQELTEIKFGNLLRKAPMLNQMEKHLTSSAEIHHKEQLIVRLKGPM